MQLIRYHGEYDFDDDILIKISQAPKEEYGYTPSTGIFAPPPQLLFPEKTN
jgi:hypothetical protein